MAFDFKTFLTRLGSAAVFSAIMLFAFLSNEWAFIALFLIIVPICLIEYASLVEKILRVQFSRNEKANFYLSGVALYLLVCSLIIAPCENKVALVLNEFIFYFLGLFIGSLITFFIFKKNTKAVYLLSGLGYLSLSFALLVQLRYQSLLLPVILLLLIWMNDTLAYLVGSFIGKTKFFPSISPKKTLEGTLGGVVFTMAFAMGWAYFTDWFPFWQWIVLACIASIAGTAGDLAESKLKRLAGVKDSGSLMPGHGGALDRFDSLLVATPVAFLFAIIFIRCFEMKVF